MAGIDRELWGGAGFLRTLEWEGGGTRHLLGLRASAFSLYSGSEIALHFDLEGRLRRAFIDDAAGGIHYIRGLDGRILRKRRVRKGAEPAPDAPIDAGERRRVFERSHEVVLEAIGCFPADGGGAGPAPGEGDDPRALLDRAAAWDADRLEAEAGRFLEAYRPLGVLPPDRYRSLILQATEGCAWNGCLFCSLYRGQRFRVKTPGEFRDHIRRVKAFLGRALALRSGVFLGEANALTIRQERILELLDVLDEELGDHLRRDPGSRDPEGGAGISSFIDAFATRDKGPAEYGVLARRGFRRAFLGIETGDEDLLRFLRKPASNEGVRNLVGDLKAAGVSVGAIILLGAGGKRFARNHVEESVRLLESLPLDEGDLIYLSRLDAPPGERYEEAAAAEGVEALEPSEAERQEAEFISRLRPPAGARRPKVSLYEIRSFVYF
jgi:hypothetical protein